MRTTILNVLLVGAVLCAQVVQAGVIAGPIINPTNGHYYCLLSQNNWTGSEAEAISLGGHLVTINDATENAWVVTTFTGFGGVSRAIWIGLNDAAVEGTFVWASGESPGYTRWGPSEPNNSGGNEDRVHIFPSTDGRFPTWNDAPNSANAFGFVFNGVVEISLVAEMKVQGDESFGVRSNRFGFTFTGTSNLVIVVEACTNLTNHSWSPVGTNTLTGGSSYFNDPQWLSVPTRLPPPLAVKRRRGRWFREDGKSR